MRGRPYPTRIWPLFDFLLFVRRLDQVAAFVVLQQLRGDLLGRDESLMLPMSCWMMRAIAGKMSACFQDGCIVVSPKPPNDRAHLPGGPSGL